MSGAKTRLSSARSLLNRAAAHLRQLALGADGELDVHQLDTLQVPSYDLAWCAAELAAADAIQDYADRAAADPLAQPLADAFAADVLQRCLARWSARPAEFGLSLTDIFALAPANDSALCAAGASKTLASLGRELVLRRGAMPPALLGDDHELMRDSFAKFAAESVAPRAQAIHREDQDIPAELLREAASLGLFGVSIPERFGGMQPDGRGDTIAMLVVTEALSHASLGAAGSLITRPEIMARALLAGGTAAQQSRWLPALAAGDKLCAISITEPDYGSDVANLKFRGTRVANGWQLDGAKTWCTFAARADVLFVVTRTDPDPALSHKGLSVLLVEKPPFAGREFEYQSPLGGRLTGRAIATLGYRGMHSYELFFEGFVVPPDALIGESQGEGRGFYLTMTGMAGGRLQTAARANGVMHAAIDAGIQYTSGRRVFGKTIAEYPLTSAQFARMAAWLTASRQFSYAVARRLDAGGDGREASLVKFFACRTAEWLTRDVMQMHGGMGYAEETLASRLFVDARVLSIFEGAEETLALKVIARDLLARAS
ncbi:MAG: acyl-CoA/acyl-ACP dehydrogenase [Proteobacteria bacterium]|nr:acyl-CoA/acyl-ACP dehydrogenase [Pseudomonadota bacterium]